MLEESVSKSTFEVGQSVRVAFNTGKSKVGKVIKVNPKTIDVHFDVFPPKILTLKKYKCSPV